MGYRLGAGWLACRLGRGGRDGGPRRPASAWPSDGLRVDGEDDRVVEAQQVVVADRAADLDVAEEAESLPRRRLDEGARDRLDVLVVGRDPEADEPPGRRQPVEYVDLDARVLALQE